MWSGGNEVTIVSVISTCADSLVAGFVLFTAVKTPALPSALIKTTNNADTCDHTHAYKAPERQISPSPEPFCYL